MGSFEFEQSYINTKKSQFESLFNTSADENLDLFMQYLAEYTNRQLRFEVEKFNKNFTELKESGFFESDN